MDYLTRNAKDNPAVLIMHNLFSYFNRLAICKFRRADDEKEIAALLGIHPFIARNYRPGLRNYSMLRIKENLIYIAEADLRLKGMRSTHMGEEHTLKTLLHQLVR